MKRDLPSPYAKQSLTPDQSDAPIFTTPSPSKYQSPMKRTFK